MSSFALISVAVGIAAFVQGSTGVGFALIVAPVVGLLAPQLLPVCLLVFITASTAASRAASCSPSIVSGLMLVVR